MIKATSQSVCSGITGCQVELLGSGAELIKEYKGVSKNSRSGKWTGKT